MDRETINFYDNANIRDFYLERFKYLNAIDEIIISLSPSNSAILDLGSGDGLRIKNIAEKINSKVTTLDISPKMSALCKNLGFESYCGDISNFCLNKEFNIITCLWSVLGYVADVRAALKNINSMLSKDGIFFTDVNIRYNFAEYGAYNCLRNIFYDFFNINYARKFTVKNSKCKVYLFDYWELDKVFYDCGFKFEKIYLNYQTGKQATLFTGQLFYIAKKLRGNL